MKKERYEDIFSGKKVTLMGLGVLGRGVGDSVFLLENGASLTITDKKKEEDLRSSLETLSAFQNVMYTLGEHRLSDFEGRDFILKAAGVPQNSEHIVHAKKQGIPVYMSAALVCEIIRKRLEGVTIIGVTGTRGKSTTTALIAHILSSPSTRVHVGGNIRGVANLPLLDLIEDGDFLVLELDSWQLQGFGDLKISPNISVFTSFMDDHMNYYNNDREAYFNDKAQIYRYQDEYDVLIGSEQAKDEIQKRDKVKVIVPEKRKLTMSLIGEHNEVAAELAYEVAIQCGLTDDEIIEKIATFSAVPGRLEDLGTFGEKQIRVFNDNNATTPEATIAALKAITSTYTTSPILIAGGADKGLLLTELESSIQELTKKCILLEGTGTSKLSIKDAVVYPTLCECVEASFSCAEAGDVIVFSPGFASFSKEFNNEYERNDAFVQLVQECGNV